MADEKQHKLIESIYDVTTNPDKYDEMLHLWESEFLQIPDDLNIGDGDEPESTKQIANMFESHFYRAFAILDMVSLSRENRPTIKQLTEADPLPVLILSASGQILMSSEAAGVQLNLMNGQQLSDIAFVDDGAQKLEQCLSELEFAPADKVIDIVKISHISNDMPVLMAMSKIYDEDGAQNFIRLAAVHMMWDDKVGENIQDMFGLSDAELYIAKHLVAGERLSDIAHARGRAVATVRTQIKSLYKKVNLNTQSELIKLFSLLQSFDYKSDHDILEYLDNPRDVGKLILYPAAANRSKYSG